ncbi:MAG: hypothetical protein MMC33_001266 [Icmadophila ericetorum]|nr:hypothetical protein [Icmadophila ericetorum]
MAGLDLILKKFSKRDRKTLPVRQKRNQQTGAGVEFSETRDTEEDGEGEMIEEEGYSEENDAEEEGMEQESEEDYETARLIRTPSGLPAIHGAMKMDF